jgi:hypothetical protein
MPTTPIVDLLCLMRVQVRREAQYTYAEGEEYVFMDQVSMGAGGC